MFKPIIVYQSRLVPSGYLAITLWPFILIRTKKEETEFSLIVHELTHYLQAKRLFVIGFYVRYVIEYLINLVKWRNHFDAYSEISFEIEARDNEELWERYERDNQGVNTDELLRILALLITAKGASGPKEGGLFEKG